MENYINYFITYLLEGLIFWQYSNTLFIPRYSNLRRIVFLFLEYTLLAIIFSLNIISLNGILFLLANFSFLYFMYSTSLLPAILHSALTTAFMGISELAAFNFFPNLAHNFYDETTYQYNYLVLMIFSKFIYFFSLFFISHIIPNFKEDQVKSSKNVLATLIVPLLSIWIIVTLVITCREVNLPIFVSRMILISAFLLAVINVSIWIIYSSTIQKNKEFTEMLLELQKEDFSTQHYKTIQKQYENQQLLIHDIKNHLQSIALLNEQGQTDKIDAYINQIVKSSDLKTITRICNNELLNAILCQYSLKCQENNINFYADVRSNALSFMSDNDLTIMICNLLDNAYETTKHIDNSYIDLSIGKLERTELVKITISNSCLINPFSKNGELNTKKKDSPYHGLGLKSVKKIAKKHNGEMQVYYDTKNASFHTIIFLFSCS